MTAPPSEGPISGNPEDSGYMHMVDLAESVLEEIAYASPNWCLIARKAGELARLARAVCEGG